MESIALTKGQRGFVTSWGEPLSWVTGPLNLVASWFFCGRRRERLECLAAQYRTLPEEAREALVNGESGVVFQRIKERELSRWPSWDEIAEVERALLNALPAEDLKPAAWRLRAEFQKTVGDMPAYQALWKTYQAAMPPEPSEKDTTALRADLLGLQAQLHETESVLRTQVRARNFIALLTVVLSVAAIYFTLQLDKKLHIEDTIVFDVFGVGMLGGVFSTLLRIQKFKMGGSYEAAALCDHGNQLTVVLSPLIGGCGAVLLFVMLAAGVLGGSLLPQITIVPYESSTDALEALFKAQLANSGEAAKLYLLCFLAGFSERLVPDVMTRLADRTAKVN